MFEAAQGTVTVFSFQVFDARTGQMEVAPFKARRVDIGARFEGEVLEGTGQEVDVEDLDAQGRYRRLATGWGELD